ncbi:urea carboxylase [Agromyces sp. Leaf222]|uniref:urea carboxylase n=1 Tax=Agromyces sp. Leaf222 TaxID=1735688 RepID=UPI0006FD000F|nr:urea carboxylase [Agromyces sp. Leaf222]KQM82228.1 urea carboxylase [Agromyces sp. Leaf222]
MTFDTVLIANRGEIARRIIRSAKQLGLRTVAVYSDADRAAPHVREADVAVRLGPAPAAESYLRIDAILDAARATGAGAVHPGYGFLSENVEAARAVEAAGLAWIGPTPEQIETFGLKHTARDRAEAAEVPLLPGTGLLGSAEEAIAAAQRIGLPVMLKATSGGGGIGMRVCRTLDDVREGYVAVASMAARSFGSGGVFLERLVTRARHVEVQVFGDGEGRVAVFGDRDCSLQRRNQKVIEEAPAPGLGDAVRRELHDAARRLAATVAYRSAGTVEFIYDVERGEVSFLEMNTRLQVEHPVTEAVFGIDLVALMLRLARDGAASMEADLFEEQVPVGHALEARVYAEDPAKGFAPSPGLVTRAEFPEGDGVRVDSWIETGLRVTPDYDPMLAKVIVHGADRDAALDRLGEALAATRVDGIVTGLGMLRALCDDPTVRAVRHDTGTLGDPVDPDARIDVLSPGLMTTVQDLPGRVGHWKVGVPPSGPMDPVSFREANLAVGNPATAPALEITMSGPRLRFSVATVVCITGAEAAVTVDGSPVERWTPIEVPAGGVLAIGATTLGMRAYLAVQGGLDVPEYLGSASTFTLGGFGGHGGRALVAGDVLRPCEAGVVAAGGPTPSARRPRLTSEWVIGVTEGPHAAPEFFTREDIDELYRAVYEVDVQSARTGVRLRGPKPAWAREDGGEAGLHPSNIHDTAYAIGALDFTGDTPIILGPDGPSLGGFVCPAVVASGEFWKVGQLRPGDTVRFAPVRDDEAHRFQVDLEHGRPAGDGDDGVLARREPVVDGDAVLAPAVTYRRDGDANLLVEYGENELDLGLRMRVHALEQAVVARGIPGVRDITAGIRSLQIQTDPLVRRASSLLDELQHIEAELPATRELVVPSRIVHLPLSWDDPATRVAIERYMSSVRDDAPWTPWNIEFIRRVNGLATVEEVQRIVFDADYLVLGLGDVYLGAPVATPIDPRHRLVTTKYNPARTWTAENSVGIGGAYMCIYGMEGPGGYQFVGRTVQIWNTFRRGGLIDEHPWALRPFDRIRWYPVSAEELLELRAEVDAGRGEFRTEEGTFSLAEHEAFLERERESIAAFQSTQRRAFDEEKERWRDAGEFDRVYDEPTVAAAETPVPEGCIPITAPFAASVWRVDVEAGASADADDRLLVLEAMKMENEVLAPVSGQVVEVYVKPGDQVAAGQVLAAVRAGAPPAPDEPAPELVVVGANS